MPTFMLFKDGDKIDSMQGAVPAKLEVSLSILLFRALSDGGIQEMIKTQSDKVSA